MDPSNLLIAIMLAGQKTTKMKNKGHPFFQQEWRQISPVHFTKLFKRAFWPCDQHAHKPIPIYLSHDCYSQRDHLKRNDNCPFPQNHLENFLGISSFLNHLIKKNLESNEKINYGRPKYPTMVLST